MSSGETTEVPRRRVTLGEVHANRDRLHAIGEQYGVHDIRVFGSVARDEATDDSDLDLLVDIDGGMFALSGFALAVEDLLHVFTQVATEKGLRSRVRADVLAEAVPV